MKVMMIAGYLHTGINMYFDLPEQNAGGWVAGMVEGIKHYSEVSLYYLALEKGNKNALEYQQINGVNYYNLQYKDQSYLQDFIHGTPVDLYHLFGIENDYSNDIVRYLPMERTLLYIQGLASEIKFHYYAGYDQYFRVNPLFSLYMKINQKSMEKRGINELSIFSKGRFIAGRTDWDAAFVNKLNNGTVYYHLDETMRPVFYQAAPWDYEKMVPFTIFVTQASYPIKATHMIVEIVRQLKFKYSNVKCYIGGENLTVSRSAATRLGVSYASFIIRLIKEYQLENNIIFLGQLNQEQVIEQLQSANVFLLASSIENSPNSLQEAMLLGTPSVSSNVGGVSTLAKHGASAMLYPFDDPMVAAYYISEIFENREKAEQLSYEGKKRIRYIADPQKNGKQLFDIYTDMYRQVNNDL